MRICLLEPYDTGSHKAWLRGYARNSRHVVLPLTLDGRFWKWRMHGGAVTLARQYRAAEVEADVILATDMLDLTTFLALTRDLTHATPVALYMHENQLTYPLRPGEKLDLHYGFINYASMLCADHVFFNSSYHLESWFEALPRLLKHFPDYNELPTVAALQERSSVLPLGLDLGTLGAAQSAERDEGPPLILWNHRWEYDKNPETLFRALYALADEGVAFRVALLGEHFARVPPAFGEAKERLGARIVQFGYVDSYAEYVRWLWRADVVVSTAIHEFFGAAIVEAMYCGCWPVLPHRLTYPQFIPPALADRCLYADEAGLVALLRETIQRVAAGALPHDDLAELRRRAAQFDWSCIARTYDDELEAVASGRPHTRTS